jgi:hypothetical protein
VVLGLVGVFLLFARAAQAGDMSHLTLSGAPAECPDVGYFRDRVAALAEGDAGDRGSADVRVAQNGDHYDVVVAVRIKGAHGERRFSSNTCRLAVDAAAVIVAISLFPERAGDVARRAGDADANDGAAPAASPPAAAGATTLTAPESREESAAPALASREEEGAAVPAKRASARRTLRLSTSLGIGFDSTALPSVAPEGELLIGAHVGRHVFLELAGASTLSQTARSSGSSAATFAMQSAGIHGCYQESWGRLALAPCLGVTMIRVTGEGQGIDQPHRGESLDAGPSAGALLRWLATDKIAARIYAQSFFPLIRGRFFLGGAEVHRASALDVSVLFGPELSF